MQPTLYPSNTTSPTDGTSIRQQQIAINLSMVIGFFMLAGKWYAYVLTDSAAILSDAAESVVHVVAVGFAVFSLWLSRQPADKSHPYGHEKISFFSAGIEGALIVFAAVAIVYEAVDKWLTGLELQNLSTGILFVTGAAIVNAGLGGYLVWIGRGQGSLILVANGKHVLTDSWTSLGVIVGLALTIWTGWLPFDPIVAILVALNIVWSGGKLIRQSVGGLMDEGDPAIESKIQSILSKEAKDRGLEFHELRYRHTGTSIWIEFHLLFPRGTAIESAHWKATEIEAAIQSALPYPAKIISHLEPAVGHDVPHQQLKDATE